MNTMVDDEIDQRIVGLLSHDGRMSWKELGESVHLSPSAVGERVRRLERAGAITGYRAVVNPAALGRALRAVVELSLRADIVPETFESQLAGRVEVVFAAYVTGAADYAVLVDCNGADGLDQFVRWCKAAGAATTESRVVLRAVAGF